MGWVRKHQDYTGQRPGQTTDEREPSKKNPWSVRIVSCAGKRDSPCQCLFAQRSSDRRKQTLNAFVDEYPWNRYESSRLAEVQIAPSGYTGMQLELAKPAASQLRPDQDERFE